jgi:hypothetical protein
LGLASKPLGLDPNKEVTSWRGYGQKFWIHFTPQPAVVLELSIHWSKWQGVGLQDFSQFFRNWLTAWIPARG